MDLLWLIVLVALLIFLWPVVKAWAFLILVVVALVWLFSGRRKL